MTSRDWAAFFLFAAIAAIGALLQRAKDPYR